MKNILFICSANKYRSRTAEDIFCDLFPNFNFESAGTNRKICYQLGTNFLNEEQLTWADKVYVMEDKHHKFIQKEWGAAFTKKIVILHIKDHYEYGDKNLKSILEQKVQL